MIKVEHIENTISRPNSWYKTNGTIIINGKPLAEVYVQEFENSLKVHESTWKPCDVNISCEAAAPFELR